MMLAWGAIAWAHSTSSDSSLLPGAAASPTWIGAGKRSAAALVQHGERRAAGAVNCLQANWCRTPPLAHDIGSLCVDDGDGLAAALPVTPSRPTESIP